MKLSQKYSDLKDIFVWSDPGGAIKLMGVYRLEEKFYMYR